MLSTSARAAFTRIVTSGLATRTRRWAYSRQLSDSQGPSVLDDPLDDSSSESHKISQSFALVRRLKQEEDYPTILTLRKFFSDVRIARYRYIENWSLSELLETFVLLRSLPQWTPALVPPDVEEIILQTVRDRETSPRTSIGLLAAATASQPLLDSSEPALVIGRIVERLLRISWNDGNTDFPTAGSRLLRPLTLTHKGIAKRQSRREFDEAPWFRDGPQRDEIVTMCLCSQEEAANIYATLIQINEDIAHASWARRLASLLRMPSGCPLRTNEVFPSESELRASFEATAQKLMQLCDDESRSDQYKGSHLRFLANEYASGTIVRRDGEKAREFWERSLEADSRADATNPNTFKTAFRLGQVYLGRQPKFYGREPLFERDVAKGLSLYEFAKTTSRGAAFELGQIYLQSGPNVSLRPLILEGVEPDDKRAAENFHLASQLGNKLARIPLAELILLGRAPVPVSVPAQTEPVESVPFMDSYAQAGADIPQFVIDLLKHLYDWRNMRWREWIAADSPIRLFIDTRFYQMAKTIRFRQMENVEGKRQNGYR